jgi:hypothetical protein
MTYRDTVWHAVDHNLALGILEVAMFFQDVIATEPYRGWLLAIQPADLHEGKLTSDRETVT